MTFYKEHYFLVQVKSCLKFKSSRSHVFLKIGLLKISAGLSKRGLTPESVEPAESAESAEPITSAESVFWSV